MIVADRDEGNKCFRIVSIPNEVSGFRWEQAALLCRAGPGFRPDIASIQSEEEMGTESILFLIFIMQLWNRENRE